MAICLVPKMKQARFKNSESRPLRNFIIWSSFMKFLYKWVLVNEYWAHLDTDLHTVFYSQYKYKTFCFQGIVNHICLICIFYLHNFLLQWCIVLKRKVARREWQNSIHLLQLKLDSPYAWTKAPSNRRAMG